MSTTSHQFKVKPKRFPSDDCLLYPDRTISEDGNVVENGEGVPIHVGEWVEIVTVQSMRELISLGRIAEQVTGDTIDPEQVAARLTAAGSSFNELCVALSERVTAWSWTDNEGVPLPQPYRQPEVLANLSNDELMYLVQASRGETPDARKKGSGPSESTS